MTKYLVLFFAAFAVFSPLFLIGVRKYTGRKAKRALSANIASFFACLVLASVVGIGGSAAAAGAPDAAAASAGLADGLKYELGYSTREAGQLMGLSWAAARKLEQRAKEKLRALCQEEGIL